MGFIEEERQLIQDFVTPEIRSIDARLVAVEKRVESLENKVEKFETKVDKRFDSLDTRIQSVQTTLDTKIQGVQAALESKIDRSHNQILDALRSMEKYDQLAERIARIESKLQNVA
jgi:tetrahydromethanopterin S-methyltransferase subunit G